MDRTLIDSAANALGIEAVFLRASAIRCREDFQPQFIEDHLSLVPQYRAGPTVTDVSDGPFLIGSVSPCCRNPSCQAKCLKRRLAHIAEKHRVDLLQHVRVHVQELPLVLDRDQRPLAAVVHGDLEGLGE